jgi:hypothetical protein
MKVRHGRQASVIMAGSRSDLSGTVAVRTSAADWTVRWTGLDPPGPGLRLSVLPASLRPLFC